MFGLFTNILSNEFSDIDKIISKLGIGAVIILCNAFINLGLFILFERNNDSNQRRQKVRFILLSFFLNYCTFLIVVISVASIKNNPIVLIDLVYIFIVSILLDTLILALQNYFILSYAKAKADVENAQLKAANADAATRLLRQQIHPHFLFNALSVLKSLYKVNTKAAEEYLIHLSDFLRISISDNNIKIVPLKDELKLCKDYIGMQKIRFGNALICDVSISDDVLQTGFVPSFSIQPLLENAIKHNELTEESPLRILVQQDGDRIKVTNNRKLKNSSEMSSGSGLANLAERYRILSNDELEIKESQNTFSVSIKILNNEDSNNRG